MLRDLLSEHLSSVEAIKLIGVRPRIGVLQQNQALRGKNT